MLVPARRLQLKHKDICGNRLWNHPATEDRIKQNRVPALTSLVQPKQHARQAVRRQNTNMLDTWLSGHLYTTQHTIRTTNLHWGFISLPNRLCSLPIYILLNEDGFKSDNKYRWISNSGDRIVVISSLVNKSSAMLVSHWRKRYRQIGTARNYWNTCKDT